MIQFKIRSAEPRDAESLAEVHVRSWQEAYQGIIPATYLDSLDPTKRVEGWKKMLTQSVTSQVRLVADIDGHGVQGFSVIGPSRSKDFPGFGEVEAIYLRERFHGQGVGRDLFSATLDALADLRFERAFLWVLENNPTRRFYEASGGKVAPQRGEIEIGGARLLEVAYTWDLYSRSSIR